MLELGDLFETTITISNDGDVEEDINEEPPTRPKAAFTTATNMVSESQSNLDVVIGLDIPATEDITIKYDISGTAIQRTGTNAATADFEITGSPGELLIAQGASSAAININLVNDELVEDDETIILTLETAADNALEFVEPHSSSQ